jgi:hypothetical protein
MRERWSNWNREPFTSEHESPSGKLAGPELRARVMSYAVTIVQTISRSRNPYCRSCATTPRMNAPTVQPQVRPRAHVEAAELSRDERGQDHKRADDLDDLAHLARKLVMA